MTASSPITLRSKALHINGGPEMLCHQGWLHSYSLHTCSSTSACCVSAGGMMESMTRGR